MKTKRSIYTALVLLAAFAGAVFFACDNSYGVFQEIQTEKPQVGTEAFKGATVKALGADASNYYAAMAKVFYRPKTGGAWQALSVGGRSDYYCAGLASDGTNVYVAALNLSGAATLQGIYKSADGGKTWTALDVTAFAAGSTVDNLFWAGTTLFAMTHVEPAKTYSLYASAGGAAFSAVTLSTGTASTPFHGIVYDGAAYWAATSSTLFTGNSANLSVDASWPTTKAPSGIALDSANKVMVTTADGYLYTNPAAWAPKLVQSGSKLGPLIEAPVDTTPSGYRLIVANMTPNSVYGYLVYNSAASSTLAGGSDTVFIPTSSAYTTTIYKKPVFVIQYFPATTTMFIGLAANGTTSYALYSNTCSAGGWSGWNAE